MDRWISQPPGALFCRHQGGAVGGLEERRDTLRGPLSALASQEMLAELRGGRVEWAIAARMRLELWDPTAAKSVSSVGAFCWLGGLYGNAGRAEVWEACEEAVRVAQSGEPRVRVPEEPELSPCLSGTGPGESGARRSVQGQPRDSGESFQLVSADEQMGAASETTTHWQAWYESLRSGKNPLPKSDNSKEPH